MCFFCQYSSEIDVFEKCLTVLFWAIQRLYLCIIKHETLNPDINMKQIYHTHFLVQYFSGEALHNCPGLKQGRIITIDIIGPVK